MIGVIVWSVILLIWVTIGMGNIMKKTYYEIEYVSCWVALILLLAWEVFKSAN